MLKKKILKFLILIIVIEIVVIIIINFNINNPKTIEEKIGYGQIQSIPIKDYTYVRIMAIESYFNRIEEKEYEEAYSMLIDEYKEYMPFEEYKEKIKDINPETLNIKKIKAKNEYCFISEIEINNEEQTYICYMNEYNNKIFNIAPDNFLTYSKSDFKEKKSGLLIEIKDYITNIEDITVNLKLENNSNKDILLKDIKFVTTTNSEKDTDFKEISLKPKEAKEISVSCNSNYDFIKGLKIINQKDEKISIYSFDI